MLWLEVWYSLWSFEVAKGNKLLEQNMHIQNLSEPVFCIISASTTFKLLHFKWTTVRYNEHWIKFLQLSDLLHLSLITFADIRPDKSIKKRDRKNVMTKLMKALLPLNLLIADAITGTVRISKCSKLNKFILKKVNAIKHKYN